MDCSTPGFPVHHQRPEFAQTHDHRVDDAIHSDVTLLSSLYLLRVVKVKLLSHVRLFVTPWTVAYQAPQSMGFSRQEYWYGLPFLSPGDLPNAGIEPGSPTLEADALTFEPTGKPIKSSSTV